MSSEHFPSSVAIRQIIPLAEKREALLKKIEDLDQKIAQLNATRAAAPSKPEVKSVRKEPVRRETLSTERSDQTEDTTVRILKLLRKAGAKGMTVGEIAKKLGMKMQNVHVWFSFKGRKHSSLQKIGQAQWALGA